MVMVFRLAVLNISLISLLFIRYLIGLVKGQGLVKGEGEGHSDI